MQTQVANIENYYDYIKCGEILKSPSESYRCPYVLKCFQCKEIYLLLESFIFHIEDRCKATIVANESIQNGKTNEMDCGGRGEGECLENMPVKVEHRNAMETEDPLIVIKPEISSDDEFLLVKEETKLPNDQKVNNDNDEDKASEIAETSSKIDLDENIEYQDDMDDVASVNSSDEIESDESESEKDQSIKKSFKARKDTERSSVFVAKFMKSKKYVSALINAYKNQPNLWNKNFPAIRHKVKRQDFLIEIAQELNDQHNLDITWKQVSSVVVYLCRKYREDLKNIKENEEKKEFNKEWYFDDLNFLKPFMENNLIAKLDSHLPDLLPEQIIQILEIYKGLSHLWNTHLIEYYCKNKRNAAKMQMLQILETNMDIKITEAILEDYLRTIHNCFTRAKKNKMNIIPNKRDVNEQEEEKIKHDYYGHMLYLYDHVGTFNCSVCDRKFNSPLNLKIHKSQHEGCEPLTCSLCNKEFKTANSYTNHAKRHMEDLNHECGECGKKFLHSTDLRIHMRNHTGAKPFCCEICGASFRHIQGFTNHRRRHEKNYLHTCHICSKGYYSKDRYNDHMNAHQNIRSQICNVCGKAFITKRSLQQHAVIHEDIRRHSCKLCGKTFKHKTGVNQHMRTHGIANSDEKTTVNND